LKKIKSELLSDEAVARAQKAMHDELRHLHAKRPTKESPAMATGKVAKLDAEIAQLRDLMQAGTLSPVAGKAALDVLERDRAELIDTARRGEAKAGGNVVRMLPQTAEIYRAAVRDMQNTLKEPSDRLQARALIFELLGGKVPLRPAESARHLIARVPLNAGARLVAASGGRINDFQSGSGGAIRAWLAPSANAPSAPLGGPSPAGGARSGWNWRLTVLSALLYVLAFNLTFFIQELFLVVPKALTPGLEPTLFHNNHNWKGDNPLASLFQGTGALAILLTGVACALLVWRDVGRHATTLRLFLIWTAFNGLFQALPQVLAGAFIPGNDVGMAMDYLQVSGPAKTAAALVAVAAIPPLALWLAHRFLDFAPDAAQVATARGRTVPALMAIPVIVAFRVPRELLEVVLPPVLVTLVGVGWMQGCAWFLRRTGERSAGEPARAVSLAWPLGATVALLLFFQLVLRPGIPFY